MASLADLVTLVTRVWISSHEGGETGEGSELCADLVCPQWMMMFVLQLSAITRIISSGVGVTELYDESISLAAAQTTTDPKNKIQITQRTKCITFTSSSLIKRINCEMC